MAETHAVLDALRAPLDAGLELDNTPGAFLASIFLVRCARNLAAVLLLCETGWAPEAQTLLRAMVEDMVTLSYISTDPEQLPLKWLRFENRRLPDAEQLLAAFSGQKMPEREDQPKYERWTRLSFNGMAKRAEKVVPGILEYLRYVYPILSDRAHGNTSASSMYMRVYPDGTVEPLYLPSGAQSEITLCNAVTVTYTTAERVKALGVTVDLGPIELAEQRIYDACGLPLELPEELAD
ncbi:MAG TPA: hypothetical protein DCP20_03710 [Coriobacteriia bacterium]|nr:MAG: hypothetical protein XD74_0542 [Actinobacteria bacterium 66_15]HAL29808.1 hypothetical protein [Coriobacteriia bacterium]